MHHLETPRVFYALGTGRTAALPRPAETRRRWLRAAQISENRLRRFFRRRGEEPDG